MTNNLYTRPQLRTLLVLVPSEVYVVIMHHQARSCMIIKIKVMESVNFLLTSLTLSSIFSGFFFFFFSKHVYVFESCTQTSLVSSSEHRTEVQTCVCRLELEGEGRIVLHLGKNIYTGLAAHQENHSRTPLRENIWHPRNDLFLRGVGLKLTETQGNSTAGV